MTMEVSFKNFRCYKDTGLLKLKKITLIVGENSSVKTSFLAGINHISGLIQNNDTDLNTPPFELGSFQNIYHNKNNKSVKNRFEYEYQEGSNLCRWGFGDDEGEPSVITYKVENSKTNASLNIKHNPFSIFLKLTLSEKEKELFTSTGIKIEFLKDSEDSILTFSNDENSKIFSENPLHFISDIGEIGWVMKHFIRSWLIRNLENFSDKRSNEHKLYELLEKIIDEFNFSSVFSNLIALAPMRTEPSRVYSFGNSKGKLNPNGSHVPDMLLKQYKNKGLHLKILEDAFNKFGKDAGLFNDISIKSFDENSNYPFSIMVKTVQGITSNLMDVGYGVSQIIPVIYEIIYSEEGTSFLLQQPEVHLHPKAQAAFGSLMARLVEAGKSFIVETHSDFILERLKYEIERGTISNEDVGILFFDSIDGVSKVHSIDLGNDGLPIDPPPSYRRFFLEELDRVWP